jgi:hypothetical protein
VTRSFLELLDLLCLRRHDGIGTVHRARHLFREHYPATPNPLAHLRTAAGIVEDQALRAVAKVLHFRHA